MNPFCQHDLASKGAEINSGTYFPFAKKKRDILNCKKGGSKHVPQEIFDTAISFKPYQDEDGNRLLYSVKETRNADAHRFLQRTAISTSGSKVSARITPQNLENMMKSGVKEVASFEPHPIIPPRWDPEKNELHIAWYDTRVEMDLSFEARVFVCIGQDGYLLRRDPVIVLKEAATLFDEIITSIEKTANEIELFS